MDKDKGIWLKLLSVSLWLASGGLMLASSGLDGAYLYKLMPDPERFGWMGLVLNTVLDVVSQVVMYWFAVLKQDKYKYKRKHANWLLVPEVLLILYAGLLSWRQLLPILTLLEPGDYKWLAPVLAMLVPIGLGSVSLTQALIHGRLEAEASETEASPSETPLAVKEFVCEICGRDFDHQNGLNAHVGWHQRKDADRLRSKTNGERDEQKVHVP